MKNSVKVFIMLLAFAAVINTSCSKKEPLLGTGKNSVKKVIQAMTPEEKAYFVTGTGMSLSGLTTDTSRVEGAPVVGQTQNIVPGAAGTSYDISRLGIKPMVLADGPAGLRISPTREGTGETFYCTAFPVATLLASTWDTALVKRVGEAMGEEVLEYGVDVILGPGMNIHRNPLNGRNFEYYSEDPFVTGKMAAAMVKGIQSNGVGTSIKHYAVNNTETNRNALNTVVSERALREIYLEGFRIAVQEGKPWTVMSSYNLINGVYAPESEDLLIKVLREDWGFDGMVMTDWFGGRDPIAMMKAGNDILMPGTPAQANAILEAIKDGSLPEETINRNIENILNLALKTPRFNGYAFSNKPALDAHAEVAREVAAEGMVLLRNNNNALPFAAEVKNIAAFGNTSYKIITGGTGSGDVNEGYSVSLVDGLQNAGYTMNGDLQKAYTAYYEAEQAKLPPTEAFMPAAVVPEMTVSSALASRMASAADIALITIGRNSGEFFDRKVEGDFDLTVAEKALIKTVSDAFHARGKKAVVILNIGGVIETVSWRDNPDAILLAWQAGQETGNSIADVLSGKVNPSGKLASTFPLRYEDVPSAKNFPGRLLNPEAAAGQPGGMASFLTPQDSEIIYEEGIYVGYRYYRSFDVATAYPFGYGLSYTDFAYENLVIPETAFNGKMTISVEVVNTGNVAGKEVVQLYISAPGVSMNKPGLELKGFAKTKLLMPQERQTVTFEIDSRSLASFDASASSWIAEAGSYTVSIGASSEDIKASGAFEVPGEIMVKTENKALVPEVGINELKQ